MVKGYELRVIGLTLLVASPIVYCPPVELSPDISFLLLAMGLVCILLGVAQKKRAEKNGGTDQSMLALTPAFLIGVLLALCLVAFI